MMQSQKESLSLLCDCSMLVPFAAPVLLAVILLLAWMAGDYVLGPIFQSVGLG